MFLPPTGEGDKGRIPVPPTSRAVRKKRRWHLLTHNFR